MARGQSGPKWPKMTKTGAVCGPIAECLVVERAGAIWARKGHRLRPIRARIAHARPTAEDFAYMLLQRPATAGLSDGWAQESRLR